MMKFKKKKKKKGFSPRNYYQPGNPNPMQNGMKLTKELIKEFKKLLPKALFLETVAASLCIHKSTWRKWIQRGRREADRLNISQGAVPYRNEALYLEFFLCYKQCINQGKIDLLMLINAAAHKQWTAAAWILERRFPQEWGADKAELRQLRKRVEEMERETASKTGGVDKNGKGHFNGNQHTAGRS